MELMDFTFEALTFENCDKAYEIDRADIPEAFVDDVPTLIETLKFGFENKLKGHAFLITKGGRILESTIEKVYNDFGIHPIVLGVHKDNEKAARFYLKNGFIKTSCMDGDDYCFIRNP